ncbi:MAG: LCP family protein [Firmicutes bacterium]|jgi:LCP family protein required for cell wall assembly|nr:LCP family protein [Bacillota bacterium]
MKKMSDRFKRSERNKKANQKHRSLVILLAGLLFFGSVLATIGIYSYLNPESNILSWFKQKDEDQPNDKLPVLKERFNLLVLGVDERVDDLGRSDTMLLFSLPSDDQTPLLISIPRDAMIYNETWQNFDRINNVFPLDGIKGSVNAVEELLGLPVHGYLKLNIEGFVDLVDIMGGVRLDVEEQMDYEDPYQDLYIHIMPGEQLLDGKTSMEYVRYRADGDGDIGRIVRQQKFLEAAMEQALSLQNITRIPSMIKQGLSMVETDLSLNRLLTLANTVIKGEKKSFLSYTLPGEGLYYQDASLYMLDLEEMYTNLADLLLTAQDKEKYLDLLQQPWIQHYKEIYADSLAWASRVWEETGMWLSQSEYQYWLNSQIPPEEEIPDQGEEGEDDEIEPGEELDPEEGELEPDQELGEDQPETEVDEPETEDEGEEVPVTP